MQNLKKILSHRLGSSERIAFLGIGSDLRGDDAAGMMVAGELTKLLARRRPARRVKIFYGGTAPENLTGEVRTFKPSHVVLLDTIDGTKKAGTILVFKPEEIGAGVSFSTHKMPARVLVDYLIKSIGCGVTIIGIQPKTVEFGKMPTPAVRRSVSKIAATLKDLITDKGGAA